LMLRYFSRDMEQQEPAYPPVSLPGVPTEETPVPQEELRTLYISGFPFDLKQREVHNLLRFFPGYEECTFKTTGVAFALFSDGTNATAALQALNVRLKSLFYTYAITYPSDRASILIHTCDQFYALILPNKTLNENETHQKNGKVEK